MKINMQVRMKNKVFWVTVIPMILILIQQVFAVFGVTLDFTGLSQQLVAIVGTVFSILALVGVVNDPTTDGVSDSSQAMLYGEPKKDN